MQKQATMAQRHPKRSHSPPPRLEVEHQGTVSWVPPSETIGTVTSRQYLPNNRPCYRSCDSSCDRSCTGHVAWSCQVMSPWQLQVKLLSVKSTVLKLTTTCYELDSPIGSPSGTSRHGRCERTLPLVDVHGQQSKKNEQWQISDKLVRGYIDWELLESTHQHKMPCKPVGPVERNGVSGSQQDYSTTWLRCPHGFFDQGKQVRSTNPAKVQLKCLAARPSFWTTGHGMAT